MTQIVFVPLFDWSILWALSAGVAVTIVVLLLRRVKGVALRSLGMLVALGVLFGPELQHKQVAPLQDIVIVIDDITRSQSLGQRPRQQQAALDGLMDRLNAKPNILVHRATVRDSADNQGSLLTPILREALNAHPSGQIAGIFAITDGVVHELDPVGDLPAPLHILLTGERADWDRRLRLSNVPAFGILGENVTLRLAVEDIGAAPDLGNLVPLFVSIDGQDPIEFQLEKGRDVEVQFPLPHGGKNIINLYTQTIPGELTSINNSAVLSINGIRDRLRVLLVSGLPNAGTRTWRNLLKSDSSVDLVHFTILRPPEKQDGVPVNELSLIAFPTRELFLDKIDDFDLIIFDRFKRRGILPTAYLENIVNYVQTGGALLIAAGPDFASAASISRSPLQAVLPAQPNGRVRDQKFQPRLSDLGYRHPVTQDLGDPETWGPWLRQIDVDQTQGQAILNGIDETPLLILDRVQDGRVALLLSDQTWLWGRDYEGGGPQGELLRRLAHWLMKEPELEEEELSAEQTDNGVVITRRTLEDTVQSARVVSPSGQSTEVTFDKVRDGEFKAVFQSDEIGLFRLSEGDFDTVFALGALSPKEFEAPLSDSAILAPMSETSGGGVFQLEDGLPRLREVAENRVAAGNGWMGITRRNAERVLSVSSKPWVPAWLASLIILTLALAAWLIEGRRR